MTLFDRSIRAQEKPLPPLPDGYTPESPERREECVRDDLLRRLRNVCKDLPEEDFHDLVAAMTREQLRGERRQ